MFFSRHCDFLGSGSENEVRFVGMWFGKKFSRNEPEACAPVLTPFRRVGVGD